LLYTVVKSIRCGRLYVWIRGSWGACRNRRFCACTPVMGRFW
jgi:hypothetical protein